MTATTHPVQRPCLYPAGAPSDLRGVLTRFDSRLCVSRCARLPSSSRAEYKVRAIIYDYAGLQKRKHRHGYVRRTPTVPAYPDHGSGIPTSPPARLLSAVCHAGLTRKRTEPIDRSPLRTEPVRANLRDSSSPPRLQIIVAPCPAASAPGTPFAAPSKRAWLQSQILRHAGTSATLHALPQPTHVNHTRARGITYLMSTRPAPRLSLRLHCISPGDFPRTQLE